MTNPRFPNVPQAPGVPPVLRSPLAAINSTTLLVADARLIFSLFGPPKWGIYSSDNQRVLFPDSIFAFSYRNDWSLSDFPIEGGGFENYDKVQTPFLARVTMTKGGSDSERHAFLQDLRIVASTLGLYSVVTSDYTYDSVNVIHVDLERRGAKDRGKAEGVGILTVDVWLQEVRVGGIAAFQDTQQPSGADPINNGQVFTARDPIIPVTVSPL